MGERGEQIGSLEAFSEVHVKRLSRILKLTLARLSGCLLDPH